MRRYGTIGQRFVEPETFAWMTWCPRLLDNRHMHHKYLSPPSMLNSGTSACPQCRILVSLVLLWFMYQVLSPALFGMHPFLRGSIVAFAIFPILNSLAVETATLVIRSPDDCVDFMSFYCFICFYIIMVMLFLVYWVSQFWNSAPNCWFRPRRMLAWIRLMSQLFGISSMHRYSCHPNCLAISRSSYLNAIVSLLLGSLAKIFLFRQLALFSRSTF